MSSQMSHDYMSSQMCAKTSEDLCIWWAMTPRSMGEWNEHNKTRKPKRNPARFLQRGGVQIVIAGRSGNSTLILPWCVWISCSSRFCSFALLLHQWRFTAVPFVSSNTTWIVLLICRLLKVGGSLRSPFGFTCRLSARSSGLGTIFLSVRDT